MKSNAIYNGLMGLLSLLGFIGVFTEAKSFLASLPLQLILNISSSNQMKCWRNT